MLVAFDSRWRKCDPPADAEIKRMNRTEGNYIENKKKMTAVRALKEKTIHLIGLCLYLNGRHAVMLL